MTQLLELQVDVMYTMWVRANCDGAALSANDILAHKLKSSNQKIGPVSRHRVNLAIDALLKLNYIKDVDLNESVDVVYAITSLGTRWVEDWFSITRSADTFTFNRRYKDVLIVGQTRAEYERGKKKSAEVTIAAASATTVTAWTKWGTIIAGVGLLVTIIIAAIK